MLVSCWASVADGGPTLNQHRVNVRVWIGVRFFQENNIHISFYVKLNLFFIAFAKINNNPRDQNVIERLT